MPSRLSILSLSHCHFGMSDNFVMKHVSRLDTINHLTFLVFVYSRDHSNSFMEVDIERFVVCFNFRNAHTFKSLDELPRVWNDALRLRNQTGIFVFRHRSINGKLSLNDAWGLKFYRVPYTGLVSESVDEGLSRTNYQLDATDENYFYRTIGELTAHYKRLFTPAVLDELVALFKNSFNKAEQERRDQINSRMSKLLALQAAEKPLPPPPTVNEWWNELTEVEKENIRAKSVPKPKTAKTAKKPTKKK